MIRLRGRRELLCGLVFMFLAGLIAYQSGKLDFGTAGRMGPGYFPMLLAGLLGALGLAITVSGVRYDGPGLPRADWRGLGLITAAIIAFGATVQPWGFVPAVLLSSLLCAAASRPFKPLASALFVAGLVLFCTLVFVWGLGMPVKLLP
jgi:putative tricarboxylic transport membrane protein